MVSRTKLETLVRGFHWKDVHDGLVDDRDLLAYRDDRGRNWLHVCCGVRATSAAAQRNSVRTADVLLDLGIDVDTPAFHEDAWQATPLWYAIGRGRNLTLARHLLERGCNPNFALWAAAFNDDIDAIRLLVAHGAIVDDPAVDETPFVAAVKVSHFAPAEALLDLGADVDAVDGKGMTALHYMLKKRSDIDHVRMVVAHGARGDIPDRNGVTVAEIMRKKRDPELRALADQLRTGRAKVSRRSRTGA